MKSADYVNNYMVNNLLSDKQKNNLEKMFMKNNPNLNINNQVANPVTGESLLSNDSDSEYLDISKPHTVLEEEAIKLDEKVRVAGAYPGGNVEKTLDDIRQNDSIEAYNHAVDYAREEGFTTNEKLQEYQEDKYGGKFDKMAIVHDEPLEQPKDNASNTIDNIVGVAHAESLEDGNVQSNAENFENEKVETLAESESVKEEPVKDESVKEEPVKDESVKEEPVKDEPVKDESVKEEPVKEEPVKDEPVKEEPVKEEPVKEEPVKEEPVKEEKEEEDNDLLVSENLNNGIINQNNNLDLKNTAQMIVDSFSTGLSKVRTAFSNVSNVFVNITELMKINSYVINLKSLVETTKDNVGNIIDGKTVVNVFKETRDKIGDVSLIFGEMYEILSSSYNYVDEIERYISSRINYYRNTDEESGSNIDNDASTIVLGSGEISSFSGGEKNKRNYNKSSKDITVGDNIPNSNEQEKPNLDAPEIGNEIIFDNGALVTASIGSLAFQTPITLFLTIGGEQIQTSSETEYGIIGIEIVDGVMYYKLIDKRTGKIYYAKCDDVLLDDKNIQLIHTIDNALILNSTDIGADDNFVKLAEPNSYYIVKNNQEIKGVNFATILDSVDGNNYFIPISENVEVLTLEQILNNENKIDVNTTNESFNITYSDNNYVPEENISNVIPDSSNEETTYSDNNYVPEENTSNVITDSGNEDIVYSDNNYVSEENASNAIPDSNNEETIYSDNNYISEENTSNAIPDSGNEDIVYSDSNYIPEDLVDNVNYFDESNFIEGEG